MKKQALRNIYATIFMLSLVLAIMSVQFNNPYLNNKWFSFIISIIIIILSLFGYKGVEKLF